MLVQQVLGTIEAGPYSFQSVIVGPLRSRLADYKKGRPYAEPVPKSR
jgi:hypothetical protein